MFDIFITVLVKWIKSFLETNEVGVELCQTSCYLKKLSLIGGRDKVLSVRVYCWYKEDVLYLFRFTLADIKC